MGRKKRDAKKIRFSYNIFHSAKRKEKLAWAISLKMISSLEEFTKVTNITREIIQLFLTVTIHTTLETGLKNSWAVTRKKKERE